METTPGFLLFVFNINRLPCVLMGLNSCFRCQRNPEYAFFYKVSAEAILQLPTLLFLFATLPKAIFTLLTRVRVGWKRLQWRISPDSSTISRSCMLIMCRKVMWFTKRNAGYCLGSLRCELLQLLLVLLAFRNHRLRQLSQFRSYSRLQYHVFYRQS